MTNISDVEMQATLLAFGTLRLILKRTREYPLHFTMSLEGGKHVEACLLGNVKSVQRCLSLAISS
jgi:hypothetical protein